MVRAFVGRLAQAATLAGMLATTSAFAGVVNFDDIDASALPILTSYAGFTWSNVFAYPNTVPGGAYSLGVISGPNAAATFSGGNDPNGNYVPLTASIKSATNFDFVSGYFGAALYDGLSVTIAGLLNGPQLFSQTLTLNATGALPFSFDFDNINEVDITVTNTGTSDPFQCGTFNCAQVTMDNLTFAPPTTTVPEPAPIALFVLGLPALLLGRRRAGR
jgi:hypothetical protein